MAVYAIADIHGEYDLFMELLDKIALQDTDTLYVIGDVVDRGPHPVKVLQQMMLMPVARASSISSRRSRSDSGSVGGRISSSM